MTTMSLRFDPSLPHQQEAIAAVTDLFEGLPLANGPLTFTTVGSTLPITEYGVANAVTLDDEMLLENLHVVQERNQIARSQNVDERRFAVEMETGTGKTYVYLRTIFELHQRYGMKKFVIVVPSVPIREGVLHSIDTMREHFRSLYDVPFDHFVYDSSRLTQIRSFAMANTVQIMVINIQAFIKDVEAKDTGKGAGNVIYREFDKLNGLRPIEYIQQSHPVVIVDEPQRVRAEKSQAALKRLNPLVTLEYSATFESPTKVYRLGPIEAYEQKLVKQIEVASVQQEDDANTAYVKLLQVDIAKQRAQVEITAGGVTDPKRKKIWVKHGDDLAVKSDQRPEYIYGFQVSGINFREGNEYVEFNGGRMVTLSQSLGEMNDAVMKAQIETTIRQHFQREIELAEHGVKVLSLFFIDRVANYRDYDEDGNPQPGKIARWFEEIYHDLRKRYDRYSALPHPPVEQLHNGYFSVDKQNRAKDTSGKTQADDDTYELIMRDKERLLSPDEPLRFIFSHSALREGWDNPNVFQICTLNETRSVEKKRQEIGRGLRLPVNRLGERIHDPKINRLTVVANESYREFAETLQREYEEDAGIRFGKVPHQAFNKVLVENEAGELKEIGEAGSNSIWQSLNKNGYINFEGEIQSKFAPDQLGFADTLLPMLREGYRQPEVVDQIIDVVKTYIFRDRFVKRARKRREVRVNENVLNNTEFMDFWQKIAQRTRFIVDFDSDQLIERAAEAIRNNIKVSPPRIRVHRAELEQSHAGIREGDVLYTGQIESREALVVPDIVTMIQSETDLTRSTIVDILLRSGRADEISINPQSFITQATEIIRRQLQELMQHGLAYEKRDGQFWQARMFRRDRSPVLEDSAYEVTKPERTVYDVVEFDSTVESNFVKRLDTDERVRYYVKLPNWFTVDTPIGKYNPDWAIMMESGEKFYLVRETKGSLVEAERRGIENAKIAAARRHFQAISVDYDVARSFSDVTEHLWQASRRL